jgi:pilus assembly protein CpaB
MGGKSRVPNEDERMSKTRILIGVLALGSGLIAAYMGMKVIGKKPKTEVVEVSKVETVDVLVAAKQVAMGDKLSNGAITWQTWPQNVVAPNMITKAQDPEALTKYETSRARIEIFEGEPILEKKLVLPGDNGFMAAILPKGMRAISVRISEETGAGGFILPNDRVDVLLTQKLEDDAGSKKAVSSETVISNVRVLAINQTFKQSPDGEQVIPEGKTATLELTPAQSEVVSMAESAGQLSLSLRSINEFDQAMPDAMPVTSDKYVRGINGNSYVVYKYGIPKKFTNLE